MNKVLAGALGPCYEAAAVVTTTNRTRPADTAATERLITAWPDHPDEWPGPLLAGARGEIASFLRHLAEGVCEAITILVRSPEAEASAASELTGCNVELLRCRYGDIWLRDTGPLFVSDGRSRLARCYRVNGWGGKFDFPDDHGLNQRVAEALGIPWERADWILEGGALEVDGEGTALTTEECLLNDNRNPELSRADTETRLRAELGVETLVWLPRGLVGDHTDGHIDNLARFVAPGRVAITAPEAGDPNEAVHREVRDRLAAARDARGRSFELIELPSAGEVRDAGGGLLAASHLNFYIGLRTVVVPAYGDGRAAELAAEILAGAMPDRRVVASPSNHLVGGGGSFHCITCQLPAAAGMGDNHRP